MDSENLYKYISPFIILAFILVVTSDYCLPDKSLLERGQSYITGEETAFNPVCLIKSFNPEPPETENLDQSGYTVATSGVVLSGASVYPSPSPSFSEFEES